MIGQHVSHYRLRAALGEGTYGTVWDAVHIHDEELDVAVKVVHPSLASDADFVAALRRECRVLARLAHPHIVMFRDLVLSDAHPPAMLLERLHGGDLATVLAASRQLRPDYVVDIGTQVLKGLGYAHRKGVIHRDVKPSNIFVSDDASIRLLDFGIARAADGSRATRTGQIMGTVDYVPPEVWQGTPATAAADVYATGLVLWECLVGRSACPPGPFPMKMGWHLGVGLSDVRTQRADCPDWLALWVSELGHSDPAARPADGNAALARLAELRDGRGQSAPEAITERPSRPIAPSTVSIPAQEVRAARESLSPSGGSVAFTGSARPSSAPPAPSRPSSAPPAPSRPSSAPPTPSRPPLARSAPPPAQRRSSPPPPSASASPPPRRSSPPTPSSISARAPRPASKPSMSPSDRAALARRLAQQATDRLRSSPPTAPPRPSTQPPTSPTPSPRPNQGVHLGSADPIFPPTPAPTQWGVVDPMWLFRECAALPERTRKRVFLQPVAYTVGGFYELWNRTGVPEKEDDWLLYVNMSLTGRRGGSDGLLVCERSLAWTDGGVVWDLALDPAHRPPTVGPGIGFTSGASVSFDLHNIAIRNTGADAAMAELVVALVRRLGGR